MRRPLKGWPCAIAVAVLSAVAACSPARGGQHTPATAPADATRVWADFVACARAHGQPAWPDPAVDSASGEANFPGFDTKTGFEAVREPCGHVLDALPPQANPMPRPLVSASEMAMKLAYSQCMREHGVPEFHDPGPDGYYDDLGIPGYNTDPEVTARVNAARNACASSRGQ